MTSRVRRASLVAIGLVTVAAGALGLATAPAAWAHSSLVASTPAEGETLTALPEKFSVTANETLLDLGTQGVFQLQVRDAEGRYYGDGCVTIVNATMSADAVLGESGDYEMLWQIVSADGHPVSGVIPFTWQAPDGFAAAVAHTSAPVCGEDPDAAPVAPEPGDSSWAIPVIVGTLVLVVVLVAGFVAARRKTRAPSDEA